MENTTATETTISGIGNKKVRFDVGESMRSFASPHADVVVVTILNELGGPDAQTIVSLHDLKQLVKDL